MRKLRILCHAATAATRGAAFPQDEPIEDGQQARLAALSARAPRFDHILCAPSLSARETAAAFGAPVRVEAQLRDMDFGRWRGRALARVVEAEPESAAVWTADPEAAPHGGESLAALLARIGAWLDAPVPGRTLAVTSAAVARAAIVHVLRAPALSFWSIDAAPLSAVDLTHDDRRWSLRCPLG